MTIVSCYHFRVPRGAVMREIRIFSSSCLDSPVKGLYSSLAIILGGGGKTYQCKHFGGKNALLSYVNLQVSDSVGGHFSFGEHCPRATCRYVPIFNTRISILWTELLSTSPSAQSQCMDGRGFYSKVHNSPSTAVTNNCQVLNLVLGL